MSGREIVPVESGSRALAKPAELDTVLPDVPKLSESLAQPKRTGYVVIGVFLLGFCLWAATAPLAGGAVATGVVSPTGDRKTIQHLEGGIVRELRVREGDKVAEGQALIILDPLQSSADYKALETMRLGLLARQARLDAESSGKTELEFSADLEAKPGFAAIAASQRQMFEARRAAHIARKNVLANRIEQLNHQIAGLDAQIESTAKQLAFIREEAAGKLSLVKKGLLPKPEALRLQRGEAELVGRHAELISDAGRVRQQIAETTLQISSVEARAARRYCGRSG